jgi:UDP-N-acetylglucosamine 2-epimerase (non-hydrolysing)
LVFSVHPRTRKRLEEFGLVDALAAGAIRLVDPMPYIEFMNLASGAAAVITDSGGVQEETTYLGIPCLTLRENTERPITVSEGSNRLVKPNELVSCVADALEGRWQTGRRPELWDGRTAQRCVSVLRRRAGV